MTWEIKEYPIDHDSLDCPVVDCVQCFKLRIGYLEAQEDLLESAQQEARRLREAIAEIQRPLDAQMARLNENLIAANARALPALHNPTIQRPFAAFVQAMADELRANAHKGDRAGWLTMNRKEAVAEVLYHAAKLAYAAAHDDDEILEFAADVANCALMVADVCDALTPHDQVHGEPRDPLAQSQPVQP
jgi:hypothetical protein